MIIMYESWKHKIEASMYIQCKDVCQDLRLWSMINDWYNTYPAWITTYEIEVSTVWPENALISLQESSLNTLTYILRGVKDAKKAHLNDEVSHKLDRPTIFDKNLWSPLNFNQAVPRSDQRSSDKILLCHAVTRLHSAAFGDIKIVTFAPSLDRVWLLSCVTIPINFQCAMNFCHMSYIEVLECWLFGTIWLNIEDKES